MLGLTFVKSLLCATQDVECFPPVTYQELHDVEVRCDDSHFTDEETKPLTSSMCEVASSRALT